MMAFLGGLQDFITGSTGLINAQEEAADFNLANIGIAQENLDPLSALFGNNIQGLQQGATVQGFDQNIQDIEGSDAFSRMMAIANRNTNNNLSQFGLNRSGRAGTVGNETLLNTLLSLEGTFNQRQSGLVDRGTQGLFAQNQLLDQQSAANAARLIGPAQTEADARSSLIDTLLAGGQIASGAGMFNSVGGSGGVGF